MTYETIAKTIVAAPRFKAVPSVDNVKQYLEYLGHPEKAYKIIHVAGTNGKGSTCSFLESIIRKAGYRTGLFTSPHLIDMRERMQINRNLVSKELFVKAYETVAEAQTESGFPPLTFFELVCVMALLIFKEEQVDYVVLETGMGGRFDATNAVTPICCVITAIGMDHMQYLGDTIDKIAYEKAGIMKPGVPCIAVDHKQDENRKPDFQKKQDENRNTESDNPNSVRDVLINYAREIGAELQLIPEDSIKLLDTGAKTIDFSIHSRYYINSLLSVCSRGVYQAENGAVAAVAAKTVFPEMDDEIIRAGLLEAFWPGRMEEIEENVVIDGAHNEPSIQAFMRSVQADGRSEGKRILVFAVAADKDYDSMARNLLAGEHFRAVILTRIPYERMEDPAIVRPVFEQYTDVPIFTEESMEKAYEMAVAMKKKDEIVYMAGSLYFVGAVKEYRAQ